MTTPSDSHRNLDRISLPSGKLAMVAMDQRESLRTMFQEATGEAASDETLADFKLAVAETLSPHASAMLLDRQFGEAAMHALASGCGLVLAADALTQKPGQPVEDTAVDPEIDPAAIRASGAAALKLLLLWRPDGSAEKRAALTRQFIDLAHTAGVPAILEGVVRPPASGDWDREAAILDAARELGALRPDLYKAEVPLSGRGKPDEMTRRSASITEALPCPWVVLSQGVQIDDFPRGVEAACRGGASGFLAGRAIWADLVGPGDYRSRLAAVAVDRLKRLREIVIRCS